MGTCRVVALALPIALLVTIAGASAQGVVVSGEVRGVQAPPRDRPLPVTTGTATIKGRVVDAVTGAPLASARVRLSGLPVREQPSTLTNAEGEFVFRNLPAGRYMTFAEKSGYLVGPDQGERRTIRAGPRATRLAEGQTVDDVRVALSRGGVVTGRVVDEFGEPVEHAMVGAIRVPKSGRRLRPDGRGFGSQTNDIGEFRIPRLERGSYLLVARSRSSNTSDTQYAPTYFPGVESIDDAQAVVVERGGMLTGVEIVLRQVSTTWVSGVVINADGKPATVGHISVVSSAGGGGESWSNSGTGIGPDGTFRFSLAPGSYRLDATVPNTASGEGQWTPRGSASITVGTEPVTGIELQVGAPAGASGRLVFEGSSPLPQPGQVGFNFGSRDRDSDCRSGERPDIRADWTFTVRNVWGSCMVNAWAGGRWTLKAVLHSGTNLMDRPIDFKAGVQLRDVQVVFTDRRTELAFEVTDDRGLPTQEFVAIAFKVDRDQWNTPRGQPRTYTPPVDRVGAASATGALGGGSVSARPLADQRERRMMSALPPAEYFVVAVDDVAWEDLQDEAYLDELSKSATRVTLGEGEVRTLQLRRIAAPGSAAP